MVYWRKWLRTFSSMLLTQIWSVPICLVWVPKNGTHIFFIVIWQTYVCITNSQHIISTLQWYTVMWGKIELVGYMELHLSPQSLDVTCKFLYLKIEKGHSMLPHKFHFTPEYGIDWHTRFEKCTRQYCFDLEVMVPNSKLTCYFNIQRMSFGIDTAAFVTFLCRPTEMTC